jgi:hypothetical protein
MTATPALYARLPGRARASGKWNKWNKWKKWKKWKDADGPEG